MLDSIDDANALVHREGLRTIDLEFGDLWGRWHHVTIPASQPDDQLMRDSVGFDGSSVGLKSVKSDVTRQTPQGDPRARVAKTDNEHYAIYAVGHPRHAD